MQNQHPEFGKGKEISMSSVTAPILSDYMNYRQFLADFYKFKRASSKGSLRAYNYAVFSAAANIRSPNYLKMIIEGKRNLSDDMIGKFGKALGLNKEATEELRYLTHFTQATDPADRNLYLKKLSEHRVTTKLKSGEIDRRTWEKVPNWIAWIIYAMVDQEGVTFTTSGIKKVLRNKASEDEIETALNTLLMSGELKKEANGEIRKGRSLIESPEEVPVALVRKLQSQLMYMGLESLYQDQPTEREFGSLTLSLTRTEFEELKFKLRQMRKSLHKDNSIARMKEKGEKVYQLNIQLFPVTASVVNKEVPAKTEAEIAAVEMTNAEVAANVVTPTEAIPVEPVAAAAVPASTTNPSANPASPAANSPRQNVSSLAATAASAADLFR